MHPVDLIAHQSFSCLNYAGLRPFLIPNIHGVILPLGDLGVTQLLHRDVRYFLKVSFDWQHPGIEIIVRIGFHK